METGEFSGRESWFSSLLCTKFSVYVVGPILAPVGPEFL